MNFSRLWLEGEDACEKMDLEILRDVASRGYEIGSSESNDSLLFESLLLGYSIVGCDPDAFTRGRWLLRHGFGGSIMQAATSCIPQHPEVISAFIISLYSFCRCDLSGDFTRRLGSSKGTLDIIFNQVSQQAAELPVETSYWLSGIIEMIIDIYPTCEFPPSLTDAGVGLLSSAVLMADPLGSSNDSSYYIEARSTKSKRTTTHTTISVMTIIDNELDQRADISQQQESDFQVIIQKVNLKQQLNIKTTSPVDHLVVDTSQIEEVVSKVGSDWLLEDLTEFLFHELDASEVTEREDIKTQEVSWRRLLTTTIALKGRLVSDYENPSEGLLSEEASVREQTLLSFEVDSPSRTYKTTSEPQSPHQAPDEGSDSRAQTAIEESTPEYDNKIREDINLITEVLVNESHNHDVLQRASSNESHNHDVLQQASSNESHNHDVLQQASSNESHNHDVLQQASSNESHNHDVLQQASSNESHNHDVLQQASSNESHNHDVLQQASSNESHNHDVLQQASSNESHNHDVLQQASSNESHNHDVLQQASSNESHNHDVLQQASSNETLPRSDVDVDSAQMPAELHTTEQPAAESSPTEVADESEEGQISSQHDFSHKELPKTSDILNDEEAVAEESDIVHHLSDVDSNLTHNDNNNTDNSNQEEQQYEQKDEIPADETIIKTSTGSEPDSNLDLRNECELPEDQTDDDSDGENDETPLLQPEDDIQSIISERESTSPETCELELQVLTHEVITLELSTRTLFETEQHQSKEMLLRSHLNELYFLSLSSLLPAASSIPTAAKVKLVAAEAAGRFEIEIENINNEADLNINNIINCSEEVIREIQTELTRQLSNDRDVNSRVQRVISQTIENGNLQVKINIPEVSYCISECLIVFRSEGVSISKDGRQLLEMEFQSPVLSDSILFDFCNDSKTIIITAAVENNNSEDCDEVMFLPIPTPPLEETIHLIHTQLVTEQDEIIPPKADDTKQIDDSKETPTPPLNDITQDTSRSDSQPHEDPQLDKKEKSNEVINSNQKPDIPITEVTRFISQQLEPTPSPKHVEVQIHLPEVKKSISECVVTMASEDVVIFRSNELLTRVEFQHPVIAESVRIKFNQKTRFMKLTATLAPQSSASRKSPTLQSAEVRQPSPTPAPLDSDGGDKSMHSHRVGSLESAPQRDDVNELSLVGIEATELVEDDNNDYRGDSDQISTVPRQLPDEPLSAEAAEITEGRVVDEPLPAVAEITEGRVVDEPLPAVAEITEGRVVDEPLPAKAAEITEGSVVDEPLPAVAAEITEGSDEPLPAVAEIGKECVTYASLPAEAAEKTEASDEPLPVVAAEITEGSVVDEPLPAEAAEGNDVDTNVDENSDPSRKSDDVNELSHVREAAAEGYLDKDDKESTMPQHETTKAAEVTELSNTDNNNNNANPEQTAAQQPDGLSRVGNEAEMAKGDSNDYSVPQQVIVVDEPLPAVAAEVATESNNRRNTHLVDHEITSSGQPNDVKHYVGDEVADNKDFDKETTIPQQLPAVDEPLHPKAEREGSFTLQHSRYGHQLDCIVEESHDSHSITPPSRRNSDMKGLIDRHISQEEDGNKLIIKIHLPEVQQSISECNIELTQTGIVVLKESCELAEVVFMKEIECSTTNVRFKNKRKLLIVTSHMSESVITEMRTEPQPTRRERGDDFSRQIKKPKQVEASRLWESGVRYTKIHHEPNTATGPAMAVLIYLPEVKQSVKECDVDITEARLTIFPSGQASPYAVVDFPLLVQPKTVSARFGKKSQLLTVTANLKTPVVEREQSADDVIVEYKKHETEFLTDDIYDIEDYNFYESLCDDILDYINTPHCEQLINSPDEVIDNYIEHSEPTTTSTCTLDSQLREDFVMKIITKERMNHPRGKSEHLIAMKYALNMLSIGVNNRTDRNINKDLILLQEIVLAAVQVDSSAQDLATSILLQKPFLVANAMQLKDASVRARQRRIIGQLCHAAARDLSLYFAMETRPSYLVVLCEGHYCGMSCITRKLQQHHVACHNEVTKDRQPRTKTSLKRLINLIFTAVESDPTILLEVESDDVSVLVRNSLSLTPKVRNILSSRKFPAVADAAALLWGVHLESPEELKSRSLIVKTRAISSAVTIQHFWRMRDAFKQYKKINKSNDVSLREMLTPDSAATKIQKVYRRYRARGVLSGVDVDNAGIVLSSFGSTALLRVEFLSQLCHVSVDLVRDEAEARLDVEIEEAQSAVSMISYLDDSWRQIQSAKRALETQSLFLPNIVCVGVLLEESHARSAVESKRQFFMQHMQQEEHKRRVPLIQVTRSFTVVTKQEFGSRRQIRDAEKSHRELILRYYISCAEALKTRRLRVSRATSAMVRHHAGASSQSELSYVPLSATSSNRRPQSGHHRPSGPSPGVGVRRRPNGFLRDF